MSDEIEWSDDMADAKFKKGDVVNVEGRSGYLYRVLYVYQYTTAEGETTTWYWLVSASPTNATHPFTEPQSYLSKPERVLVSGESWYHKSYLTGAPAEVKIVAVTGGYVIYEVGDGIMGYYRARTIKDFREKYE